jgi:hypothetical protein
LSESSIGDIGKKLAHAGRLKRRPLCVYGSSVIPKKAQPSTSVDSCVARAIMTLATHSKTPPLYLGEDMIDDCCGGGAAMFGFRLFHQGIKYFVSYGSPAFRNGAAEYLRATPDLVDENQKALGRIRPLGKYVVIQACEDMPTRDPGVKSVLVFGMAEQIRNLCSLVHFSSHDPFKEILMPQGPSCASFVTFAAGMAENAPRDTVFLGPADPTGNYWFPPDHLSLAIPIDMARRMCDDLDESFIVKRPKVAYPIRRTKV